MSEINGAVLKLIGSLWAELGAPLGGRRHRDVAVDPEPLIAWTPHFAAEEPRILGLAFDWCVAHHEQITKVRLPGLARNLPEAACAQLASFNGALRAHGVQWRPASLPTRFDLGRLTMALPMNRPALVRFRVRALSGASARADVLCELLATSDRQVSVADLTPSGSTTRSVERILNELVAAGWVAVDGSERRRRFRMMQVDAMEKITNSAKLRWLNWHLAFTLAADLVSLESPKLASDLSRRVEAARRWKDFMKAAQTLNVPLPPGPPDREDIFSATMAWGAETISNF